jgi:hypothetical protein
MTKKSVILYIVFFYKEPNQMFIDKNKALIKCLELNRSYPKSDPYIAQVEVKRTFKASGVIQEEPIT